MTDSPPVLTSIADGVAHIELNRPESFNALSVALASALAEAVLEAGSAEGVRVVLLSGRGRAFCAGGDVKAMAAAGDPGRMVHELVTASHRAITALAELAKPVVAVVHGSAAGAGLGYACAADLVLAGESAKFLSAFTGIGLSPDSSTSWQLPRMVGLRRALELTLLNRVLTAQEALEWGLVTRVLPDEEVLKAGQELARNLAAGPALALGRTRRLVRDGVDRRLVEQLQAEAAEITELVTTDEARALVRAFAHR